MGHLLDANIIKWLDDFMPDDVTYVMCPDIKSDDIFVLMKYKGIKLTRTLAYPGDLFDLRRALFEMAHDVRKKYEDYISRKVVANHAN